MVASGYIPPRCCHSSCTRHAFTVTDANGGESSGENVGKDRENHRGKHGGRLGGNGGTLYCQPFGRGFFSSSEGFLSSARMRRNAMSGVEPSFNSIFNHRFHSL